jgi:hypothetical protein
MMKNLRKKKEVIRRITTNQDRNENKKEGELKLAEIAKARARPLSVASKMILREEANSATPLCSLADVIEKKYGTKPHHPDDIRKWIHGNKSRPKPDLAYPGSISAD